MPTTEKLDDHQRQLLIQAVLAILAREGCDADPDYTALLAKLVGVDTVVFIGRARQAERYDSLGRPVPPEGTVS